MLRLIQIILLCLLLQLTHPAWSEENSNPITEGFFRLPDKEKRPKEAEIPLETGRIDVQKFNHLRWSPDKGFFRAQGDVLVRYTPLLSATSTTQNTGVNAPSILKAKEVYYNIEQGQVTATGGIDFLRPDGQFLGEKLDFNFQKRAGFVTKAELKTAFFRMKGERIEATGTGGYSVFDGEFTTCENEDRPDYRIRAGELTVTANQYVVARKIRFYAGKTLLISLPTLRQSLKVRSAARIPRIGYNRAEGISVRFANTILQEPNRTFDYNISLSVKGVPIGFVNYQQDLQRTSIDRLPPLSQMSEMTEPLRGILDQLHPPTFQDGGNSRLNDDYSPRSTFYATLQSRQFVFNRNNNFNLILSRLPEVGVRFSNILGRNPLLTSAPNSLLDTSLSSNPVNQRIPRAPFLLDAYASLAMAEELPTGASAGRFLLRINAASQPIPLFRNAYLRFGVSNWLSAYTRGTLYNLFSPEVELNLTPTRTSLFGVGYRYANDTGRTPFLFDRRDVRHEFRLRYQVGGPWGFGILARWDMERFRSYETEIAILRNLDCLQAGFGYRFNAQQFNLIFNFLPPTADRNRFRRAPIPTAAKTPSDSEESPRLDGEAQE